MAKFSKLTKTEYENGNGAPKDTPTDANKIGAWDMEQITGKINEVVEFISEGYALSKSTPNSYICLKNGSWVTMSEGQVQSPEPEVKDPEPAEVTGDGEVGETDVTQYKIVYGPDVKYSCGVKTPTVPSTGKMKIIFKSPLLPSVNSSNLAYFGTFKVGYYKGKLIIGNGRGFHNYPIAGLENKELVCTFDQDVLECTLTADGVEITSDGIGGTMTPNSGGGMTLFSGIKDHLSNMELEYIKFMAGNEIVGDYDINEGSGNTLHDKSGNDRHMTIVPNDCPLEDIWVPIEN